MKFSAKRLQARFPSAKHEEFMRRAIANARRAGVELRTGGAFGAVIVDGEGAVLADGLNLVEAQNDPTWHAEIHAIRQAGAFLKTQSLSGCILYTSGEPCPMCLAAAYWAKLDGIVYASSAADAKRYGGFDDAGINREVCKPSDRRAIPAISMLRNEAVDVWKEYARSVKAAGG